MASKEQIVIKSSFELTKTAKTILAFFNLIFFHRDIFIHMDLLYPMLQQ